MATVWHALTTTPTVIDMSDCDCCGGVGCDACDDFVATRYMQVTIPAMFNHAWFAAGGICGNCDRYGGNFILPFFTGQNTGVHGGQCIWKFAVGNTADSTITTLPEAQAPPVENTFPLMCFDDVTGGGPLTTNGTVWAREGLIIELRINNFDATRQRVQVDFYAYFRLEPTPTSWRSFGDLSYRWLTLVPKWAQCDFNNLPLDKDTGFLGASNLTVKDVGSGGPLSGNHFCSHAGGLPIPQVFVSAL